MEQKNNVTLKTEPDATRRKESLLIKVTGEPIELLRNILQLMNEVQKKEGYRQPSLLELDDQPHSFSERYENGIEPLVLEKIGGHISMTVQGGFRVVSERLTAIYNGNYLVVNYMTPFFTKEILEKILSQFTKVDGDKQ